MKNLLKWLTGGAKAHPHFGRREPAPDALASLYRPGARYIATKEGVPMGLAEEITTAGIGAHGSGFNAAREAMYAKAREIKAGMVLDEMRSGGR